MKKVSVTSYWLLALAGITVDVGSAQTVVNGARVQVGPWDASGATYTLPAKRGTTAQLPASCTVGAEYFATDAPAGQNKYLCTAANTWTQQQGISTFVQAGAGAVARTVASKLQDTVHVRDFGATGDGVSNDAAAFTAALASGATEVRADAGTYHLGSVITIPKGVTLRFGPGIHTLQGIRFTDSTTDQTGTGKLQCAGSGASVLQLNAGANDDVVSQVNFASLTTQNSQYGLFRAEINGCTFDGNKANQTAASYGVRLYGHGLVLSDVTVRNAYSDGIYTEWGMDSSFANPNADLEGYFTNIRSMFNGSNGWTFRGPHDSDFSNVVLYKNGGWGIQVQALANTYNGNGHFSNLNTFLNASGGIYSNSSFDGTQVAGTSNGGWGLLVDSGAGGHSISSGNFSGPTGVEVRAPSQIISAIISNTTTSGLTINGGSGNFSLQMFSNTGTQLTFSSENGPSTIFANSGFPPGGTLMSGTPAQNDFVYLDFGGSGSNRYMSVPVGTVHVAGWAPQFPQSNATMAVIGDMTQAGNLHATNLTLSSSAQLGSTTFAALGAGTNGSLVYCSDCAQSTPCAGSGTGAMASYGNGAWSCAGSGGGSYTFRDELSNTSGTVDFNPFDGGMVVTDEFMPSRNASGLVGSLGWNSAGMGGGSCTVSYGQAEANHPGVLAISSGATAGYGCSLNLADSYDFNTYSLANLGSGGAWSYWETQAIIKTDDNVGSVANARYAIGFTDNTSAYHTGSGNEIAIRYDNVGGGCSANESTTDWVYEVVVGGVPTCVDSGVSVAPATWYHLRIYSSTPGIINFQINGAHAGSISTAPTANLAPVFFTLTNTTTSRRMSVDYWAMKIRGLNR